MPIAEAAAATREGYCSDCASTAKAGDASGRPSSASGPPASKQPDLTGVRRSLVAAGEDRLSAEERSWIRGRARNLPSANFVVGAIFALAWLTLILGLLGSIGAGVGAADCEETLAQNCENATRDGFIVFGAGAGGTIFTAVMLWGFAHLLDASIESRERLEDLYSERIRIEKSDPGMTRTPQA